MAFMLLNVVKKEDAFRFKLPYNKVSSARALDIDRVTCSLEGVSRISIFKLFANIPILNGIPAFCVSNEANPVTDSPYPNNTGWWNVICFGIGGGAQRMVQITSQVYRREYGFEGKNELWIRSLHDDT